jgi:hypothetical protein
MISKSTIVATALFAMGLASPALAQVPGTYYGYAGAYGYPYELPPSYAWGPYGWPYDTAAGINYNIHTPPNH